MEATFKMGSAVSMRPANDMRVDVAIFGARSHYAVARILARADLLGTLYTDTYIGNKPHLRRLLKWLPARYTPQSVRKLLGREVPELSSARIVSFDALGLKTAWLVRQARSWAELEECYVKINSQFCEAVVSAGFSDAAAIYAYNGAALEIFQTVKKRGVRCILEQAVAPIRILDRLLIEEEARWPGSQSSANPGCGPNLLAEREEAEWQLADRILCVSEFVATGVKSLVEAGTKCWVVPYGIDTATFRPSPARIHKDRLNVLFAGAVGLRKGVPYLLEALRKLSSSQIHCRLVGHVDLDLGWLAPFRNVAEVLGTVPRSEITRMYDWADVFVLPSICEGSAGVTYEALACGLPVITTPNSGSMVRDGIDGFVVPIRHPDAIATCLERLFEDRELLRTMSENARQRGLEFGLERYAERLISLTHSLIGHEKTPDEADRLINGG